MIRQKAFKHLLAGGACALALVLAGSGASAQGRSFNIPAGDLKAALDNYITQSGDQLIFSPDDVAGKKTQGVHGVVDGPEALTRLLVGTGLTVRRDASGAEVITRPSPLSPRAPDTAVTEIVVTAQKKSENIQDVPLSVTAVSSETLTNYGASHLSDYAALIPGLTVDSTYGVPGDFSLTIRGITTGSIDGNTTVAVYIDDVPVSSATSISGGAFVGADLFPYDIDHVEVLEGPQGTLYGASSLGGLLKYVTKTPDLNNFSAEVGETTEAVGHSSQLGEGVNGEVNIPIIQDQLGMNLSYAHQFSPGYIDNVATGQKGYNHGDQDGAHLEIYWKPTPKFSAKLGFLWDEDDFKGLGIITADEDTQKPTYGYYDWYSHVANGQTQTTKVYSANLVYDFGPASLTSVTGYSQASTSFHLDASGFFEPIFGVYTPYHTIDLTNKFTQELRLTSPQTGRFQWLAGLFFTTESDLQAQHSVGLDPVTGLAVPAYDPFDIYNLNGGLKEIAGFGNATFKVTDSWTVGGGVRYSRDTATETEIYAGPAEGGSGSVQFSPGTSNATTYSVFSQYQLSTDNMVYGRISTGFRPGGLNGPIDGAPATYDPDTLTNYEIGLKSKWFDNRLTADIALYYIDWNDIQIEEIEPITDQYFFGNAAKATSEGVELTASYVPVKGLKLGFNGSYTDAVLQSDAPAVGGVKGDQLPSAPKWSNAVSVEYTRPINNDYNARVGLLWRYIGARNSEFATESGNQHLGAYNVVDFSVGIMNRRWQANLFVKNLADEHTYVSWIGFDGPTILAPRTVGLDLSAAF